MNKFYHIIDAKLWEATACISDMLRSGLDIDCASINSAGADVDAMYKVKGFDKILPARM